VEGKVRCHTIPARVVENERHVLLSGGSVYKVVSVNNMKGLGLCSQRLYFAHALNFCLPERSEGSRNAGISGCGDRHSNSAVRIGVRMHGRGMASSSGHGILRFAQDDKPRYAGRHTLAAHKRTPSTLFFDRLPSE
jgi:hypothetical protein